MADCGITNLGGTFAISTTAENDDLTLSEFEALSYTVVGNMGTHGDTGVTQNRPTFSTWDRPVVCKGKGEADAGSPDITFQDIPSAGMDLMLAAALYSNTNSYATRIEWADGSKEYNRGIITGPTRPKGGNEDFKTVVFGAGYNQIPEVVEAPSA